MQHQIAIIIPVHDDAASLEALLTALKTSAVSDYQLVVIDDCSAQSVQHIAQAAGAVYERLDTNRGAAAARNRGVALARSETIAFIDSDCAPQGDWITACIKEFDAARKLDPQVAAVCGKVSAPDGFFRRVHDYAGYAYVQGDRSRDIDYLNTACVVLDRTAFLAVGGFSENFRVGEDPELALKLVEHGLRIRYSPRMAVLHNHTVDTLAKVCVQHLHWGMSLGLKMERKHLRRVGKYLVLLENPLIHFLLIPALALLSTCRAVQVNRHEHRRWLYAPFIFCAKLFFRWGVFCRREVA